MSSYSTTHGSGEPDAIDFQAARKLICCISDRNLGMEGMYSDLDFFDIDPDTFYASHLNHCGILPSFHVVSDNSSLATIHDAENAVIDSSMPGADITNPVSQEDTISDDGECEASYLTRHFAEVIGPWLDLYDIERYFASRVPVRALRNSLLRYALLATAAKQLGQTSRNDSRKTLYRDRYQQPASISISNSKNEVDWFYKAANYYDKAISHLRAYLYLLSDSGISRSSNETIPTDIDDLLAAISIFSLYEFLGNFDAEWLHHLNGLQCLLVMEKSPQYLSGWPRRIIPTQLPSEITRGRRAAFWNFAREDYTAAYIYGTKTRLDTEDFEMWRAFGLKITDNGELYLQSLGRSKTVDEANDPSEDLVAHTLIWIVLRIMNFIGDNSRADTNERWMELQEQLHMWHRSLPDHFQPCVRSKHYRDGEDSATLQHEPFTELFFSLSICAAALQLYHFAWILLLLHKPATLRSENGSVSDILRSYREELEKIGSHCRDICGIALAHSDQAARVHMQQPLYVAGLCVDTPEDRKVILELLREIEVQTGCPTGFRMQQLLAEWGVESASQK